MINLKKNIFVDRISCMQQYWGLNHLSPENKKELQNESFWKKENLN